MLIGELIIKSIALGLYIAWPFMCLWWTIVAIYERDILGILLSILVGWLLFIGITLYMLGV